MKTVPREVLNESQFRDRLNTSCNLETFLGTVNSRITRFSNDAMKESRVGNDTNDTNNPARYTIAGVGAYGSETLLNMSAKLVAADLVTRANEKNITGADSGTRPVSPGGHLLILSSFCTANITAENLNEAFTEITKFVYECKTDGEAQEQFQSAIYDVYQDLHAAAQGRLSWQTKSLIPASVLFTGAGAVGVATKDVVGESTMTTAYACFTIASICLLYMLGMGGYLCAKKDMRRDMTRVREDVGEMIGTALNSTGMELSAVGNASIWNLRQKINTPSGLV